MENIVILVPHPDDEVLGFGGLISKLTSRGYPVTVAFAKQTSPEKRYQVQAARAIAAATLLGFEYTFLGISSEDLTLVKEEVVQKIENCLIAYKADRVYTTSPTDTHQDHVNLFKAVKIATRICGRSPVKKIFCGEVISSSDTSISPNSSYKFNPNYYEELSQEDLTKKIKALQCYEKEVRLYPHPRSPEGIQSYAEKRGMEAGVCYGEAFECLRVIA
jgi:LmbE family N-acetylglucosaminyl deacetylase